MSSRLALAPCSTTIGSGGSATVSSGGAEVGDILTSGGTLTITAGGSALATIVSSGARQSL